ncbi:LacI family DNA-binding transcriptional regulator [Parasediminibacterium sp. JCM 36343]|uniref:LacI family DNA-binding transcriptional regulator n=1 Tax=Parasediminibacterium sp. JCM 36343 TaxID=3374279 RepID=UPI00397A7275
MKKMSIKHLAKELNVSTATISYILNGKAKEKRISEELEKKVKKFAKEHNYNPNQLAKSLRSGKTKIICLMVEDIADVFFATVAGHIEEIAYNKGYKILYCSTKNDTLKTKELINTFRNRNVDGYIITPPKNIEQDILSLIQENIPVVTFDRHFEGLDVSYVGMDNFESSFNATNHLLEQGYKHVAFITLDSNQSQMKERLDGYEKAMSDAEKPFLIEKIAYANRHEKLAVEQIEQLLKNNPGTDALYFGTNYLAVSGLEAINKIGLKLGKNLGMVVFDDNDLFRVHQPTITAVAQPIEEMSIQLINILLNHLEAETSYVPQKQIIPSTLIIRQSSAKKTVSRK